MSVTFFFWSVVASVPDSALSTRFSMRCWNLAGSNAWPSVLAKAALPAVAARLPARRAAMIVVRLLRRVPIRMLSFAISISVVKRVRSP